MKGTDHSSTREFLHYVLGAEKTGSRANTPPRTVNSLGRLALQINGQFSVEGAFVSCAYKEDIEHLPVQNSKEIGPDARNANFRTIK